MTESSSSRCTLAVYNVEHLFANTFCGRREKDVHLVRNGEART